MRTLLPLAADTEVKKPALSVTPVIPVGVRIIKRPVLGVEI